MILNKDELGPDIIIVDNNLEKISEGVLSDYYEDDLPEFSLTFVSPDSIRQLNRNFRHVDSVTDVLSFESGGETDPETGKEYLGDIIICADQAKAQADQSGHPLQNEIELLMIHGLLHLLGYDHMDDASREEMWKYQNMYLDQFNVKLGRKPGEDFDF